jgi:hypothetical protein
VTTGRRLTHSIQFFVASVVYYTASTLFPAREAYVDEAIYQVYDDERNPAASDHDEEKSQEEDEKKFMPPVKVTTQAV